MTVREIIAELGGWRRAIINGLLGAFCMWALLYLMIMGGHALGIAG